MDRECYKNEIRMTESENRRRRMSLSGNTCRIIFVYFLIQCLSHTVLGQNNLVVTIQPSSNEFVAGVDYILLCKLDTSTTGSFSGKSPLTWSSSAGSLPPNSYEVEAEDDVGSGIKSYKNRLNFNADPSLTRVQFTCSARIGTATGSKVFTMPDIIIKPNVPVLTGPTTVRIGEVRTWTCVSEGASIESPNVYFRDSDGNSLVNKLDKNTRISTDNYNNFLYRSETTLTTSLPAESAQFLLNCISIHEMGAYNDQQSTTLSITVLFPPQITKNGGDSVATTENVRTTISCNIAASSPAATSVTWTKDGQRLFIDPNRYEGGTVNLPSLIIKSAIVSDAADYVCSATNAEGTGNFTNPSRLTVRYSAKFDYPSGTSFTGGAGTTFTLPCAARAVPNITTIRWKRILNGLVSTIRISLEPRYSGGEALNKNYGLTISSLQPDDANGQYFCEVDNDVGSSTSPRLTLVVNASPVITTPPPSVNVQEGQTALLPCEVTPLNTLTSIIWSKDALTVDTSNAAKYSGGTTSVPSLTIFNAADSDVGTYRCTATNNFGSQTGGGTSLVLTYKPRVTVQSIAVKDTTGKDIPLTCVVSASPNPTLVYWRKDGGPTQLSANTNPSKYQGGTIAVPSLVIRSTTIYDTGSYECVATNSIGTTISKAVAVNIVAIPTVTSGTNNNLTPSEGDKNWLLECKFEANPLPTDLFWTRDGTRLDTASQPQKYIGGTLSGPNLIIRTVESSDKGKYVCNVVNSEGTGRSATTDITVRYKPVLTVVTAPITIDSGSSAFLSCSVNADPPASQVYWVKDGNVNRRLSSDLDPAKYVGGTVIRTDLTVLQTTINDDGDYACVAVNIVGSSTSDAVKLIVQGTPTVEVGNRNPVATEGDSNLVLQCTFQANPTPSDFYWSKDGKRLDTSQQQDKYSGGTLDVSDLTIKTVSASDKGQYVCNVVNPKGLGSSPNIQLTVRYKPVLSVSSSPIVKKSGTNVALPCTVDAFPTASEVYWTKDGSNTKLSSASNPSKYGGGSASNPSLTIIGATIEDSGAYVCNAVNEINTGISSSVNVSIEGQPTVTTGNTNPTATEGDKDLVLQCGFQSNPKASEMYWTKDGSRLDTVGQPSKYLGGTVDSPSLTIRTVAASDKGQYVCHVVNSDGTGSSPAIQLNVRYKPIVSVDSTAISVPASTPTTLTCTVDAHPKPKSVYWAIFGQRINTSNSAKYEGGTVDQPNLSIVKSALIDSGDYTCVVENDVGITKSKVLSVSFTSIPKVTATVPAGPIPENSANVALSCDFQSVPSADVLYWTKGGSQISSSNQADKYSGGTLSKPTLTILTIAYTDRDEYVCHVRNSIGTGSSPGDNLNVTYAPRLIVSNSVITSSPGTKVNLACQINANPPPTEVYWRKAGVQLSSANNPSKYLGGSIDNPTLSIVSLTFDDSGSYTCVAVNSVGTTVSKDVVVSTTNVPVVSITPASITVESGTASHQITCSHISNPAANRVYWTKDGKELDTASQPAKYTGGNLASPSLVIKNVDKSDRGVYVCKVVNSLGTGFSTDSTLDVTFKPDLVVPITPVQGSTGSPVVLPCSVDANPQPTNLYWTKDGIRIVPSNSPGKYSGGSLSKHSLTIQSPTFDDSGSYQCVVVNDIGTTTSGSVKVDIISIPSVTAILTVSSVSEGASNIILTCNFKANPEATDLHWAKDGVRINSAALPSKYSGGTLDTSPNLTIRTVERSDKGTYLCRVTNDQGIGSSLGLSLDVTYKPTITVTDTPILSEPGNAVTLICSVTANPGATDLYWAKIGGSRISSSTNPSKYRDGTLSTPTLTILDAGLNDSGNYTCVATNTIGTTTSGEVSVQIVAVPTVSSTATVSIVQEGTKNIVFTCSYKANPSPTRLYWTLDNKEINVTGQPDKYLGGTLLIPSLTIRTVSRDDTGPYRCHVVNSRGTGVSVANSLDVTFKPTIDSKQGNVQGKKGQQVTLTCDVTANPALTLLIWTKDLVQINLGRPAGKYSGGTIAEPDLTISNLDESSDPGTYQCVATNKRGSTKGDEVQLTVTFDPVVNIGGDVTAKEGDSNVAIQCDVQMFPAATSITWFKDGSVLQLNANPARYSGGTTSKPSLTILTLATSDAGVYKCSASNGQDTKESGTATLTVTYTPKIEGQSAVEAKVGQSVTLPCVFSSKPAATRVEWKKTSLSSGSNLRTTVSGSRFSGGTLAVPSLTISTLTVADTGRYICIVSNSLGSSEGTVDFRTRYQPQSVQVTATPQTLRSGNQFVLTCSADAYPSPTSYDWFRGTATTPVFSGATYTKAVAQPADNANFRCAVSNLEGTTSNSLSLNVTYAPVSNRGGVTTVSGGSGSIQTLICDVTANPPPTSYQWTKGSIVLVGQNSQSLTVQLTTDSDFGEYSCTATNSLGTMSPAQQFVINDGGGGGGPDVGASTEDSGLSTTTIVLIVIIVIIVLIIIILIIIFCCLQGTCAKCCGKKEKSRVAPAVKPIGPPMYSNGGYFGPVVTPESNGKLKLNDDDEVVSPRRYGAGPIISVPENRGGRAHHLPPLNLESPTNTPREERRRTRKKKRRRRQDDETHLTNSKPEEEVEVTNVYSNMNGNRIPLYEEV